MDCWATDGQEASLEEYLEKISFDANYLILYGGERSDYELLRAAIKERGLPVLEERLFGQGEPVSKGSTVYVFKVAQQPLQDLIIFLSQKCIGGNLKIYGAKGQQGPLG